MPNGAIDHAVLPLFAELVDYPKPELSELARRTAALLAASGPEAAELLAGFARFADETPLGELEEIYTGVFELNAHCHLYVGYHLFGETYKRSVFLLGLKERYQALAFSAEPELPDHLAAMLRFLSLCDDPVMMGEWTREALLPALEKMIASDAEDEPVSAAGRAYESLLQALRLVLEQRASQGTLARVGCPA